MFMVKWFTKSWRKVRNIHMKQICIFIFGLLCLHPTTKGDEDWRLLFNGENLDGWEVHSGSAKFEVSDGAIVGTTVPMSPNTFLCTTHLFSDFELVLEVKCDLGLNSGIQIRSQITRGETKVIALNGRNGPREITLPDDRVHGYQVEVASAESGRSGGLYDEARRFIFLDEPGDKPGERSVFKDDQWNHFRIRCQGDRIQTWVNGVACADVKDSMDDSGIIGSQVHGNISVSGRVSKKPYVKHQVRFRNIRIRLLNP